MSNIKYFPGFNPCEVFRGYELTPRAVFSFASDAAEFVRIANVHDDLVSALQELVDSGGIVSVRLFNRVRDALAKAKEGK